MKLFCSGCGYFFEPKDKIIKEEIKDFVVPYRYYHKKCLPRGALVIDKGSLKYFTDKLEGKYKAEPVLPLCESCHKPFNKRSNRQKYCEGCLPKV